jgi:Tol biopolymer transport system component
MGPEIGPFRVLDEEVKSDPWKAIPVRIRFQPGVEGDDAAEVHFLVSVPDFDKKIGVATARVRALTELIAFSSGDRDIACVRPDGSRQRTLARDGMAHSWSPDGMKILFEGRRPQKPYDRDFYLMDRDGEDLRRILSVSEVEADFPGIDRHKLTASAGWMPDGRRIWACAGVWPNSSNVYLIELETLKRTKMNLARAAWSPEWSPDGRRITFMTFNAGAQAFRVCVACADGSRLVQLSEEDGGVHAPHWLADGRRVVFLKGGAWSQSDRSRRYGLCMKDVDGGDWSETSFLSRENVPDLVVSPHGEKIATIEEWRGRTPSIRVFQLLGNSWREVSTVNEAAFPSWSPDGTRLTYVSMKDQQIWVSNADGTGGIRLTQATECDRSSDTALPHGRRSAAGAHGWPLWSPTPKP